MSAVLLAQGISQNSYAHVKMLENGELQLCEFAPENKLKIPAGLEMETGGLTETEYNDVLDKFERIYKPLVTSQNRKLVLNRMWSTDTVNSNTTRRFKKWIINAYGGLARYPGMTKDGETLVLCHEMGHQMGGFPAYPKAFFQKTGMANEGQSDYFASAKCFRRVVQDENNTQLMAQIKVPAEVVKSCSKGFTSSKDIAICERAALAGKVLGVILHELGLQSPQSGEPTADISFSTPDQSEVAATTNEHPYGQCRTDTYLAGAICAMSMDIPFGAKDPVTGACAEENQARFGFRPHCWYKPQI